MRAGLPMVWRRGAGQDSVVRLTLRRRGATARVQMVTLHFERGATMAESPPLPPGVYDVVMPGGRSVVAVNASRELVPRMPTARAGPVGGTSPEGVAPLLRDLGWVYLLLIGLLCGEWIVRRRAGLG